MNITLAPAQEQWLRKLVDSGRFTSVDDAVRQLITDGMFVEDDDLAWAAPWVERARTAAARGEIVSVDAAEADIDVHLASLER